MKSRVLITLLTILTVMNVGALGAFLYVHMTKKPPPMEKHWRGKRFDKTAHGKSSWAKLDSTDRAIIKREMREFRSDITDLTDRTQTLEQAIIDRMLMDPVPRAEVDSLLTEMASVRLEMSKRATNRLLDVDSEITPEQRERILRAVFSPRFGPRK